MVVELFDGKRLECEFKKSGGSLGDALFGGADMIMSSAALGQKSTTDRWVSAVKDAISERKDLITQKDKMFCRYCGNKNPLDSMFCEKCGKKIG